MINEDKTKKTKYVYGTFHRQADKKKEDDIEYKCPVCHKKITGSRALSYHISTSHDKLTDEKKSFYVVLAIYGSDKLNKIIRQYKSGSLRAIDIPYNIMKYIRLADIEKDKKKPEIKKIEKEKKKIDNKEQNFNQKNIFKKTIVVNGFEEKLYVKFIKLSKNIGKIILTDRREDAIDFLKFKRVLKNYSEINEIDLSNLKLEKVYFKQQERKIKKIVPIEDSENFYYAIILEKADE